MSTIFNSTVLPKAIYGSELWNNNSSSDLLKLQISQNFCLKHMQGYQKCISTDFALITTNAIPIVNILECQKLKLLGQLCRLNPQYLAKDLFNNRLVRFLDIDRQCFGFIPDVYTILQRYNLTNYLHSYVEHGTFPSKGQWKQIIERNIVTRINKDMVKRLKARDPWGVTAHVIETNGYSPLWLIAKDNKKLLALCKTLMNGIGLLISNQFMQICKLCNLRTGSLIIHKLCYCTATEAEREKLWTLKLESCGIEEFKRFIKISAFEQCVNILMLGSETSQKHFLHLGIAVSICKLLH